MGVTVQSLYSNLKVLDEAILGVNGALTEVEKLKKGCISQCEELEGIKEQADCTELAAVKADLELMQQKKQAKEYSDMVTSLYSASAILINLKMFITAVKTVDNGEIVVPSKAVTCLVEEGINRYGTYEFAEHIAKLISGGEEKVTKEKVTKEIVATKKLL